MFENLLQTKLTVPPLRPSLIPRPQLIERLQAGLGGKLTLVSAPAGFGKTTLITAWVQQQDTAVAWLSLEKNDDDLRRFLTYLLAALQEAVPGRGMGLMFVVMGLLALATAVSALVHPRIRNVEAELPDMVP